MVDTPRQQSYMIGTSFRDGQAAGSITPQFMRDFVVTVVPTLQTLTTGASVTMSTTILFINKTAGNASATAVTLPASPITATQIYLIKDQGQNAASYNITVTPSAGLIEGQSSLIMNQSGMAISLLFDGTNWNLV